MRLTEFAGDTGGFELDVDSGDVVLTDGTRRLLGLSDDTTITMEEGIGFYHPDDRADVRRTIDRAAEAGEQTRGTWRLQTLDGDQRFVDVTITPATESSDVTTLRGAIHDVTERRQRRQELEQIETVFQHAQDGLFLMSVDEEFTTERVNPAYEDQMGVSAEQARGRSLRDTLGREAGKRAEAQCRRCVERREPLEAERTVEIDGEQTYWQTRIAPVVIDGTVEYIAGAIRDVTDVRERQRELSLLQQAIDDANVSITLADPSQPDQPLVYVNDAFEEMTGYQPEETLGRNCRFLQDEDTDPETVAALREAIDNEEPISVELRNYRKDGTEFWNKLTVTPIYDDGGALVRYLGTQEDITDRKEREQELERTRDLLCDMEKLAGIGAWGYDPGSETLVMTGGARRIYGLGPDADLTLEEAFEYFHPKDRERLTDRFDACLEAGEPYEIDLRLITDEGTRRWVTARGERVDESGGDSVVRGYIQGITDEKTRERQLIELNRTLRDLWTAETHQEVADIGVEAAKDILDLPANAVHVHEADDVLRPVAQTDELTALLGEAPDLSVTDSIAGRVYRRGEPTVVEDVRRDPDAHEAETDLGGHIYLPLADHGILVAGSEEQAAFNRQDTALGELLAEHLAVAFDRIDRDRAARRRRERLSLFFEESPLGVVEWDDEFRFKRLNARAEELLGYDESELRGESWEKIVADGARERVGDAVERLLDADGGTQVRNRNVRKDGAVISCEWHNRAVTDADGGVRSIFSKFQDISERESRKRELKRYETIVEALADAVYVVDEEGRFTYVNDEFVELVGYDRETILGNTPSLIKHGEAAERAKDQLGRLLSSDGPDTVTFDVTIHPREGEPIVCEDHMGVLPYDGEEFDGSVGMLRDITDRNERERRLKRQNERLEEFASVVSHDLRNPLRTADGRGELLREERESEHIDDVAQALDRIDTLIEDLLALAREGDQAGDAEPVVLADLVDDCWQNTAAPDAEVVPTVDRTVRADRSRLRQLLENLFRSAVEHGTGNATIRIGELEAGFYVEDDGPGIPEEHRDEVFEAGYSTSADGTGFGLRIVRQVADAHGWEVAAVEGKQGGARFEITGVEFADR